MENGETIECFAARLWEGVEKLGLDEMSMAYGGSDWLVSFLTLDI